MEEKEIWKPVKGLEERYEVSNLGRVKSKGGEVPVPNGGTRIWPERIMKLGRTNFGYLKVGLRTNDGEKVYFVHRLVAEVFSDNPYGKLQVNHIDGDKTNNKADNLEWVTPSENTRHALRTGLKVPITGKDHYAYGKIGRRNKPVIDVATGKTLESAREAAKYLGVNRDTLKKWLNGTNPNPTTYRYIGCAVFKSRDFIAKIRNLAPQTGRH